jgi:hypothetical protein
MLKAIMVLVYKRLDTIECPSINNPYQPPLGAAKWLDYEKGEVDPWHVDNEELEYANLNP